MDLANRRVTHLAAFDSFPTYPEVSQPFANLAAWGRNALVAPTHIPTWWTAYNQIKHSNAGLKTHGTLANATAAVAAIFLLIEQVFGFCILNGGGYRMPTRIAATQLVAPVSPAPPGAPAVALGGNVAVFAVEPRWARLFATG